MRSFPAYTPGLLIDLPSSKRDPSARVKLTQRERTLTRLYSRHYYDGPRALGYGGYSRDGRWLPVAKRLHQHFGFVSTDSLAEIGCAKGFLLEALIDETPLRCGFGIDVSLYCLSRFRVDDRILPIHANAVEIPLPSDSVDYVISINSLHNFLDYEEVVAALKEMMRVARKDAYIRVAAYRNTLQRSEIEQWATAGRCFLHTDEWMRLFEKADYTGCFDWWHPNKSVFES